MNDSAPPHDTAPDTGRRTAPGTGRRALLRSLALAGVLAGTSLATLPPAAAGNGAPETYTLTIRHLDRTGATTGG
ncbi:hypothetical protein [Streptomyces zaomyceticus]|uniref:hypothetical protein n=1 Tax=Streptomyces zaomyceticus TaxID=68286 RepID=UPI0034445FAA